MAKNLIPEIIKILGVELFEEFKVVSKDGSEQICDFTMRGLFVNGNNYDKKLLVEILCGDAEVVKLPWKPREGQTVYSFYARGMSSILEVISFVWVGSVVSHQALVKAGWVFKTKKEAKAALPTIAKEMGVKYKL